MNALKWQLQAHDTSRQINDTIWPIKFSVCDGDIWANDKNNKLLNRRRAEILTNFRDDNTCTDIAWDDLDLTIQYKVKANWQRHGEINSASVTGKGHVILGQMHVKESHKDANNCEYGQLPYVSLRWNPIGVRRSKIYVPNGNNQFELEPPMRVWVDVIDGSLIGSDDKAITSHQFDVTTLINSPNDELTICFKHTGNRKNRCLEISVCNQNNKKFKSEKLYITQITKNIKKQETSCFKFGAYVNHKDGDFWDKIETEYKGLNYYTSNMGKAKEPELKNMLPNCAETIKII